MSRAASSAKMSVVRGRSASHSTIHRAQRSATRGHEIFRIVLLELRHLGCALAVFGRGLFGLVVGGARGAGASVKALFPEGTGPQAARAEREQVESEPEFAREKKSRKKQPKLEIVDGGADDDTG